LYERGVYREACRPLREIETDLAWAEGERKKILEQARNMALCRSHSAATLRALASATTFEKREAIRRKELHHSEQRAREAEAQRHRAEQEQRCAEAKEAKRRDAEALENAERERQAQDDLHALAEAARAKATPNKKRARINRRNGKFGGRPIADDFDKLKLAIEGVKSRRMNNPMLSMKRACELESKNLTISWQALQRHVRKNRKPL
jgi:membrane protein involved in colicin uptake